MLFSFFKTDKNKKSQYETEKALVSSGSIKERKKIASNPSTHPEILYYIAEHEEDVSVRKAVAENVSTPLHASARLSHDKNVDVRLALAARLTALLPDLSQDKQSQLYHFATEALGVLALDEVLKIRTALSSALKDCTEAPSAVVGQLARDIEREVSEPILRFCAALSDEDLLDILKSHPASWAVQAIAARPRVTEPISAAVIGTGDVPAGTVLMNNKGAEISLETLKTIVEKAKAHPEWQKPVAMRKNLSPELLKELAGFVDVSVRNVLLERTDFDAEVMEDVAAIVQRRVDFMAKAGAGDVGERVAACLKAGTLNDDMIQDALSVRDYDFVKAAFAALLKTPRENIETIIGMKAAKPITAMCWKAGLSMRLALRVQQDIAKVPHAELLYPRGGTDFPLSDAELQWQADFLNL